MLHMATSILRTAIFIKNVCDWFNQLNVKNADYGNHSQDVKRNPIRRETVERDLSYIFVLGWRCGKQSVDH